MCECGFVCVCECVCVYVCVCVGVCVYVCVGVCVSVFVFVSVPGSLCVYVLETFRGRECERPALSMFSERTFNPSARDNSHLHTNHRRIMIHNDFGSHT